MRVGTNSPASTESVLFALAKDAGILKQNGLDVEVIFIDIPARLAEMDRLGIDAQVVYPTLFLMPLTEDLELDVALCRAYNRFMAAACAKSHGRIRWVAVPPRRCIKESLKELKAAKDKGAVGVFFRGQRNSWSRGYVRP